MDSLDKFFQNNRQVFNKAEPSPNHFRTMKHNLGINSYIIYQYAAIFIIGILLVTTVIFVQKTKQNIPFSVKETKTYYSWLIQQKLDSLVHQNLIGQCQLNYIKNAINNYQLSEQELYESSKDNTNSDYISKAIINQYHLQLQTIDNVVDHKYFCNNLKHKYNENN